MLGFFIQLGRNIYGRVGVLNMKKQTKSKYTDVPVKSITNGVIVLSATKPTAQVVMKVIEFYTMPDGQRGIKLQVIA